MGYPEPLAGLCKKCNSWVLACDLLKHEETDCTLEGNYMKREIGRDLGIPGKSEAELALEQGPLTRAQFVLAVKLLGEKRALELAELHGVTEDEE